MPKLSSFAIVVALSIATAQAADQPTLALQIVGNTLTVSGVKPRGDVIFFGRSIGRRNGMALLERFTAQVTDADGDGIVTWTPKKLLGRSVWAAIDFETGAYGIAAPPGFTVRELRIANDVWRGGKSSVNFSRDRIEFLLVRPKTAAWTLYAYQGGHGDSDGRNDAWLRADLALMQRLYGEDRPAPPTANARDLLLAIDPANLDLFLRVAE